MQKVIRRYLGRLALVAGLVVAMAGQARAQSIVWTGPIAGDNMPIFFSPIVVDQLTSITGPGYMHNHGATSTVFTFDVHYSGGSWQTIFSTMIDGSDHALSSMVPPGGLSFTSGSIDGLRLTDQPVVDYGYHAMTGTTFNFETTTAPEPASLVLLGTGMAGLAVFSRRRKRDSGMS